jgi:predicted signal transduction protein with EAL and GGDEF domain
VRWGGDEFAILLPDSHLSHARLMAERIRLTVETFPFDTGTVTVSIGTAQLSDDNSFGSLFRRADKALYEAKRHGRNRIETDQTDSEHAASVERLRLALHEDQELPSEAQTAGTPPSAGD